MNTKTTLLGALLGATLLLGCPSSKDAAPTPTTSATVTPAPTPQATSPSPSAANFVERGETPVHLKVAPQQLEMTAVVEPFEGEEMKRLSDQDAERLSFQPAEARRTYKSEDFRFLLPATPVTVGEVWKLPQGGATSLLTQFHPSAREKLAANMDGAGAYAILRARSDQRAEILFRVHAQLEVHPSVSLSPAQFEGQTVLNTETGQIESVHLSVPTRHAKNLNFEIHHDEHRVGMIFAPRFELSSGPEESRSWEEEMEPSLARQSLAKRFYAFEQLDWVEPEEALSRARESGKPLFAVVIEGVLNDQSC